MKKLLLITLGLFINLFAFSQTPIKIIDSLKQVISQNPPDSLKIKAYSDLCWYYGKVETDSAFAYGNLALKLSKSTDNLAGEAQALNDIGILHYGLADYNQAMKAYNESLKIRSELKDTLGLASLYNKIGLCYQNTFQLDSAIIYNTKALEIYEQKNNLKYASALKGNIANIYRGLKQYDKALKMHLEIAETANEIKDFALLTRSYNNIANAYLHIQDTLNSVKYFKEGISEAKKYDLNAELGALYNNYGSFLSSTGQTQEAIDNMYQSLIIRRAINDNQGIASSSLNLGGLYMRTGQYNKAKSYLKEGLQLAEAYKANELRVNGYYNMSYYYAYMKNSDSVIYFQNKYKIIEDSIFNDRITKEVADVHEKYNANEREKEILMQRADLAEKERDISQKNSFILGLVGLAAVISLLGFLVYNQQKLKNRQLKKEGELKQALTKIETQNRLQEQRLHISRDLHDNIGAQLTFIISSLDNLKYGFQLPDNLNSKLDTIGQFTTDTIYELRDTIWAMNKNEITYEDLQSRISNFIEKANKSSDAVTFNFQVNPGLETNKLFTSIQGMNLYRIIQEALNNALKYANATKINVDFSVIDSVYEMRITDNGAGFNSQDVTYGNGLNNIKKRAHDLDAELEIISSKESGTIIRVYKTVQS
ncbi:tetratricopeptide repeat-containing sensor histidine kinase [Bizionia myxarmorum]|uniref:histidine kinase n=1 Tax=Bizionia myxarmorum TaxID=291186 RepID=A0A5D0R4A5_9FLAO|nr:tetratricopeptide repeat-containing sensor histidine kinase [Bizionia myxarmorum]TYB75805.1 tetratricopeptide repeat protein [Bizionia myxarmorum]